MRELKLMKENNPEWTAFEVGMRTILKANPEVVKSAMEAERVDREEETKRTGKRSRGRPPKASSSGPSSSSRDA